MIEEASAEGGAQGMMKKLGYGNLDQGYPAPGLFNVQRKLGWSNRQSCISFII